jgi:hypothetical protein
MTIRPSTNAQPCAADPAPLTGARHVARVLAGGPFHGHGAARPDLDVVAGAPECDRDLLGLAIVVDDHQDPVDTVGAVAQHDGELAR